MQKRVQLKDIAKRLGLTVNTVSRSLKDKDDISEKTKNLVKKVAAEMGYIPDEIASSLRSGYTKTIGVMFDNISNPYYMIMTELINNKIKNEGYNLMIFTSSGDHARFDIESFNKMISRRIDGIITFLKPTNEVAKVAKTNNIPLLIIGRDGNDIGIDSVDTDDFFGGYLVGKHLIKKGHTKIGYVGVPKDIECSVIRYKGLTKALEEYGLDSDLSFSKFMEHGVSLIRRYVDELIEKEVTAIFCFNDIMAFEVIDCLNDKGLSVPNDIAIVGYDNIQSSFKLPIKITTIACKKEEVIKDAVEILMKKIRRENTDIIYNKTFDVFLIERMTG